MYIVTARKYRPQVFADLVGQSHVSETLHNALTLDRVAQAYLFSGPRGVGKTTAARILAKAVNCTTPLSDRIKGEPCRKCESCTSFEEGRSLNIIEIDAASNNSVEDVRALREKVAIPPQGARKKVYIIDEVHMLSNAAFNALLKTLEEPPPHALFIFATTEPHKVLATIISRTQRFDFRRITLADMSLRLKEIAGLEDITADDESLLLISRRADGALRDALSTFDQAVALCGTTLNYPDLVQALGVIATELFFEVTDAIAQKNPAKAFDLVHQLTKTGNDFQEFLGGLSEHIRNLMLVQAVKNSDLIEASEVNKKRYEQEALRFQEADLLRMLALVSETEQTLRLAPQPRLRLELLLLKLIHLPSAVDIGQLLAKLAQMEKSGGGFSAPPVAPSPRIVSEPEVPLNTLLGSQEITNVTTETLPTTPPKNVATRPAISNENVAPKQVLSKENVASSVLGKPAIRSPKAQTNGDGVQMAEEVALAPIFTDDITEMATIWAEGLAYFQTNNRKLIVTLLANTKPIGFKGQEILVEATDAFTVDMFKENAEEIRAYLQQLYPKNLPQFSFSYQASVQEATSNEDLSDPFVHLQRLRQSDPLVQKLIDKFGGEPVY